MATLRTGLLPDPTFYPSPKMAMQAAPEKLAFVSLLNPSQNGSSDALALVDVDPQSPKYGQIVGEMNMPFAGDELHHFGWNACSSCLCPYSPHPHMERRYLVIPGLRSSRIHIIDIKPDPRNPRLVKVIEPETVLQRTGYSRPHTSHCGPDGIYINAIGSANGDGPGGIFVMDPETFEIKGRWEEDRGPQFLAYDFLDIGLVPRRHEWQRFVESTESDRHSSRAGGPRSIATASQGIQSGAASGHRH